MEISTIEKMELILEKQKKKNKSENSSVFLG